MNEAFDRNVYLCNEIKRLIGNVEMRAKMKVYSFFLLLVFEILVIQIEITAKYHKYLLYVAISVHTEFH